MTLFRHRATGQTIPGEVWQFGLYSTGSATLTAAEATWSSAVQALFDTDVLALYATDMTVATTSTATIDPDTGKQQQRVDTDQTLSGSSASPSLPPQVCEVVTLKSAMATRASRGRFYLPALATNGLAAGRIDSDAVATLVTGVNALWAEMDTGGLALTLYSQTSHGQQAITRGSIGDVFDTQRRRRDKLIEARTDLTPPS